MAGKTKNLLLVCAALLLRFPAARGADDDGVAMAVRVQEYAAVRRLAGGFLGRVLPDYHNGLPDAWLAPALYTGGIEGIDERGSIFFLALDTPSEGGTRSSSVVLVPVLSPSMYLDALRAALGRETASDGNCCTFRAPSGPERPDPAEVHVRIAERTVVLSKSADACKSAAELLREGKLNALFRGRNEPGVQVRLSGRFIAERHDAFYRTIYRLMLMGSATFGSKNAAGYAEFYTATALAFAESTQYLFFDFRPSPDTLTVRIAIRPRPNTVMQRFLSAQRPMTPSLLKLIPGEPVFAAEARVESLEELKEVFPATVRRMFGLLPSRLSFAGAAQQRAGERLAGFGAAFTGLPARVRGKGFHPGARVLHQEHRKPQPGRRGSESHAGGAIRRADDRVVLNYSSGLPCAAEGARRARAGRDLRRIPG